jgi:hypothetical protein
MTVKQLIARLGKMPQDAPVYVAVEGSTLKATRLDTASLRPVSEGDGSMTEVHDEGDKFSMGTPVEDAVVLLHSGLG